MRKPLALVVLLVLSYVFVQTPHTVFACGGATEYPLDLEQVIADTDVIVYATVVYVDDGGNNSVLMAHYYLASEYRPMYLALYDVDPAFKATISRGYERGCLTIEGGSDGNPTAHIGMTGYFTLNRAANGVYEYSAFEGPGFVSNLKTDEIAELESVVAAVVGDERFEPNPESNFRPLHAPLRIVTDAGQTYSLPVDLGEVIPHTNDHLLSHWEYSYPAIFEPVPSCAGIGCRLYAPDYGFFGDVETDGFLSFDYPYRWDGLILPDGEAMFPLTIEGERFSFSPNNTALVVWFQNVMSVYRVSNTPYTSGYSGYSIPYLDLVAEIEIRPPWMGDSGILSRPWEHIRWSADGTTLIYSDLHGLWLLDVLRSGQPERIVHATGGKLVFPVFASTTGRYVGYRLGENDTDWSVIDRISSEVYHNALPSPDELYMAYFMEPDGITAPRGDFASSHCLQLPCSMVTLKSIEYFSWSRWNNSPWIIIGQCREPEEAENPERPCMFTRARFDYRDGHGLSDRAIFPQLKGVAYQAQTGQSAVITGETTLMVNGQYIDLAGQIEGNIIDVAWLKPVFYERN